jgi:hypothetical protein
MNIWMDRIEQRVMVKYCFLKGRESKLIHKELVSTPQDNAISLSTVKNWLERFKSGKFSCGDEERTGRPLISFGPALHCFLKKFPFASAWVMAGNFSVDRTTIKSILDQELCLRKFTRRLMAHILSAEQKLRRVKESQSLLSIRANLAEKTFRGSNQTNSDGAIFLSQRTREQTHPQGTCEYTSGQCNFTIHRQELAQEIQIQRSFMRRRRTAWKTSDFYGPALQCFLKKFPFASARVMAGHFSVDRAIIKSILDWELGLRQFTHRWVPQILSAQQKLRKVKESQSLLSIRANLAEKTFRGFL